jgi:hypothetical protein
MEDTLEYWQDKLTEFEEALLLEEQMEVREDSMLRLLKMEIASCKEHIKLLSND